ncbi:hypothetical protein MSCd_6910 [Mycoplasma mycoides subsp. mycoides KH3J]|nr:hypothetical protein MSCd_6910 [Mycoplasma mycoides subsp. mycoides KH3J]
MSLKTKNPRHVPKRMWMTTKYVRFWQRRQVFTCLKIKELIINSQKATSKTSMLLFVFLYTKKELL